MSDLAWHRHSKVLQRLRTRESVLRRSYELRSAATQTVLESKQAIERARAVCAELQRIRAEIDARRASQTA